MSKKRNYSHITMDEVSYLASLKEAGLPWSDIQEKYNKKFNSDKNTETLKQAYYKYRGQLYEGDNYIKTLKDTRRSIKQNSIVSKENRALVDYLNEKDDFLEAIGDAVKKINKRKYPRKILPSKKGKTSITKELLLSDIHYGQKTTDFDLKTLNSRLDQLAQAVIDDIERDKHHYNIDRFIIACLGDLIHNSTMHGLESLKGAEFGNPKQIFESIVGIFERIIEPIYNTGIKNIDFVGVTGNHDRDGTDRTFNNPGLENFTYTIYQTIKKMCEHKGMNIKFHIPIDPWAVVDIYGNKVLYEHYDNAKGADRKPLQDLMVKRANQLEMNLSYMRGGHYHEPTSFNNGRIMINGSLVSDDSYAKVLGFTNNPSQTLNTYAKSSRRYKLYKSFIVLLD